MAKGTIVKRAKGAEIPEAFLDKVFAELKPNAYAYIVAIDDEVLHEKQFVADLKKDAIIKLLKGHDDEMFIFLQRWEGTPPEFAALQPFDLIKQEVERENGKKEEQVFFAAVAEGDFSNFHRDASTNSDEFFLMLNVVEPRVNQLVDVCDGDTDKITEQLKKEIVRKEFREAPAGLGAIGIACASGEFILYAKDGQFTKYPWGEVSNTFGYDPNAKPAEESMADRMRSKIKIKSKISPQLAEPKVEDPPASNVSALKTTTVPVIKQVQVSELEAVLPSDWNKWANKEKKQWQNINFGTLISGWRHWKAGQTVKFVKTLDPPDNKDLANLDKVVQFQKDTQPHHVKAGDTLPAAASDPKPSEIGVSPLPELKALRAKLMDNAEVKALLTAGAAPIMSMSDLDKLKAKTPSFSELSGMEFEQGIQFSGKILDELHYKHGEAGWYLLKALFRGMQIALLKGMIEKSETELSETHEVKDEASKPKGKFKIKARAVA